VKSLVIKLITGFVLLVGAHNTRSDLVAIIFVMIQPVHQSGFPRTNKSNMYAFQRNNRSTGFSLYFLALGVQEPGWKVFASLVGSSLISGLPKLVEEA
jgi:hypothetical protein